MKRRWRMNGTAEAIENLRREPSQETNPIDQHTRECMIVVLAAIEVGANVDRIVERTGYTKDFIDVITHRMRESGIWVGELVPDREEWEIGDQINMNNILLHALVAKGLVCRKLDDIRGAVYFAVEDGGRN